MKKNLSSFDHRWDPYLKFLNKRGIFLFLIIFGGYLYYNYFDVDNKVPQILEIDDLGFANEKVTEKKCYKNTLGTSIYKLGLEGVNAESQQIFRFKITFYEFPDKSSALVSLLENLNEINAKYQQTSEVTWENLNLYFIELDSYEWDAERVYSKYNIFEESNENIVFIQNNNRLLILESNGFFKYNKQIIDVLNDLIYLDYSFIK